MIGRIFIENYIVSGIRYFCNVSVPKVSKTLSDKIDYYELTLVLSGGMTYIVNGETHSLSKNDAIFLTPGTNRKRLLGKEPCKYVSFNFYIFPNANLNLGTYLPCCVSSDIKKIISAFPHIHFFTPSINHTEEKIANILNYILMEISDTIISKSNNDHIIKIIKYIDENITEKMSLQTISKEINLSKEYTCYIFKKEMNKSLTDYINEKKLFLAKELISNHRMSLADISQHLGYANYNYFSRLFKKQFGISPITLKQNSH